MAGIQVQAARVDSSLLLSGSHGFLSDGVRNHRLLLLRPRILCIGNDDWLRQKSQAPLRSHRCQVPL